jgi:HSP20 family protein
MLSNWNRNMWEGPRDARDSRDARDPFAQFERALGFPSMMGQQQWPSMMGQQQWPLSQNMAQKVALNPAVDVRDLGENLAFHMEAPGCKPENLHVDLKDGNLVISGDKEKHKRDEGANYIHEERSHGSFSRSFRLPEGTKPEDISANFDNGVLDIMVKKAANTSRIAVENRPGVATLHGFRVQNPRKRRRFAFGPNRWKRKHSDRRGSPGGHSRGEPN